MQTELINNHFHIPTYVYFDSIVLDGPDMSVWDGKWKREEKTPKDWKIRGDIIVRGLIYEVFWTTDGNDLPIPSFCPCLYLDQDPILIVRINTI